MKISINKKTLLYITLFSAVFNDVLRIGGTDLSMFRLIMVITWIYCIGLNFRKFSKWFLAFAGIMSINMFQTGIFAVTNQFNISFSLYRYISYVYFAFCIFTVIYFTVFLYEIDKEGFIKDFTKFIYMCSYGILIIFTYIAIARHILNQNISLFISNVNNYGMYLDCVLPFFILRIIKNKSPSAAAFFVISMLMMAINDCKINIIGCFAELLILLVLGTKNGSLKIHERYSMIIWLMAIFGIIFLFCQGIISLNGHGFLELVEEPLRRLVTGKPYANSVASIPYRVNVIIVGIQWLFKTKFIGIGFGNSNILMRHDMETYNMKEKLYTYQSISLHNAPLALLLDFGFLAVIFYMKAIKRVIKVAAQKNLDDLKVIFGTVGLSIPVWILSPAGITTTYFLFIIVSFLYLSTKKSEKLYKT